MGFTARLNHLRAILGENKRFEREKRISFFEIVVCLISTFSVCTKKKSLADAHRNFIALTGKEVSRSSFRDRLASKRLLDYLEKAVLQFSFHFYDRALSGLSWLSQFPDVYIWDASPIRLPNGLSKKFPGNRKNHSPACLKLSALYRLSTKSVEWLELAPQKIHDSNFLPDLQKLKGALFLFDLGYYSHLFLHTLNEIGVWFVCRLKANSTPIITQVVKGISKRHIGRPLTQNIRLRGPVVEIRGALLLPSGTSIELRLIAFRFPKTTQYRWYVTNLSSSMLRADLIYPIYRLRWQIELFFKSIKSLLNADQITSENENIALTICYSNILSSLVANSMIVEQAILSSHVELKSITAQRLMMVYSLIAHNFAQCLLRKNITGKSIQNRTINLLSLLVDPNRKHRPTSLEYLLMLEC